MRSAGKAFLVLGIGIYIAAIFAAFSTPGVNTEEGVRETTRILWNMIFPLGAMGIILVALGLSLVILYRKPRGYKPRKDTKPAS